MLWVRVGSWEGNGWTGEEESIIVLLFVWRSGRKRRPLAKDAATSFNGMNEMKQIVRVERDTMKRKFVQTNGNF